MIIAALVGLALSLQATQQVPTRADGRASRSPPVPAPTDSSATAVRAAAAPVIDGKDGDQVWVSAPVISAFKEWRPTEGKQSRFKTEAKVAYDASNLYVFVRAFDPHPDSIIKLLERRDSFTSSDMIWLFIDSYHDRRTGYEFGVNAAGVKTDGAIFDDGNEDFAWDGVWDVATRIDSLGWTAEYRIPLSQMRYSRDRTHTFGITIDRDIYRYSERESWPLLRQSKPGFVSQFGSLHGLDDLEAPRRLEAVPYVVTKNASRIVNNAFTQRSNMTAGADVKYRIAPNLTLDATINPDFGQVEADPAVLNLSAYESFFDERRPFFVAGRGLFRLDVNCSSVNCSGENLFYSRRIGRTPELAGIYGDTVPLQPLTILGAGKLIGRFPSGTTVGVLDAITQRAASPGDTTYDPATNFAVVRATQEFRKGGSTIGAILTAVNRRLDEWSSPYLASSAYAAALDFRHRLFKNNYEIAGSFDQSRVQGSPSTILSMQRSGVHNYQRPDADLPLDPNRTVLGGNAEEFKFGKIAGQHLNFETAYQRRSPGFEINDLGYLRRADQVSWNTWMGYFDRRPHLFYNRFQLNNNWWQYWTTDGLPQERAYNTNTHITFKNNWGWHMGGTIGQLGKTYDDRAARGGPAIRQDRYIAPWLFIVGDDRKSIVPFMGLNYFRGDGGRSSSLSLNPEIDYKLLGRFSSALIFNWSHNISDNQFYGRFTDAAGLHYTFAHLDQHTTSVTARLNYTFTPDVSLQTYLQPFVSKGTYSDVRQLSATPRADAYDDRYALYNNPAVTSDPGGFNFKQLQSNVVFRWEYKPGSTLFAVWNQGRQGSLRREGVEDFRGDVRDLFGLHPANTFLVKVSYWLNR
ncbi:MAG: carbohydrate binding family 9 domain-containing protein [Gemmatimonadota bacterium]|nr:carbohydrate binding family 9 domain-containing protein [Gemmatimonadota bacterium]